MPPVLVLVLVLVRWRSEAWFERSDALAYTAIRCLFHVLALLRAKPSLVQRRAFGRSWMDEIRSEQRSCLSASSGFP